MSRIWWRVIPAALIVFVLLSGGVSASTAQSGPHFGEENDVDFDKAFIDFMVPHHRSAIEMIERSLERIDHPELREMAEMDMEMQQEEIDMMLDWREEWYGSRDVPPITAIPFVPEMPERVLGMETMNAEMEIDKLMDAPEPFDAAFMFKMILHHGQAIEASLITVHHAEHQRVIDLAEKIAVDQKESAEQMHRWMEAWYFE